MSTSTTSETWKHAMFWAMAALAAVFFVLLMALAINNAQTDDQPPGDTEITPAEGEQGPDGEG